MSIEESFPDSSQISWKGARLFGSHLKLERRPEMESLNAQWLQWSERRGRVGFLRGKTASFVLCMMRLTWAESPGWFCGPCPQHPSPLSRIPLHGRSLGRGKFGLTMDCRTSFRGFGARYLLPIFHLFFASFRQLPKYSMTSVGTEPAHLSPREEWALQSLLNC